VNAAAREQPNSGITGPPRPDVVVVGGGVAGLVVAWELARAGRRPVVLESSSSVGGCVARHTVGGLDLDSGAESYSLATDAVTRLLGDLQLAGAITAPNPVGAWVRHAAGAAPLPAAALLGIPARPLAADVRHILGPLGAARAALDRVLPAKIGAEDGTSLGALVRRRMGRAVVDRLVEPVAGGVYSTEPDELDVDAVAPRLRAALRSTGSLSAAVALLRGGAAKPGSAVAGLTGGMFTLVLTLEGEIVRLGGRLRLNAPVSAVAETSEGWSVRTAAGTFSCTDLVLAVPGPVALALLAGVLHSAPGASTTSAGTAGADSAGTLDSTALALSSDVLLATLVVRQPALNSFPRGTGVLASGAAGGVTAKALTHATAKWTWLAAAAGPDRHVLRLSYGRGAEPLPAASDLLPLALADAAALTGVPLLPRHLLEGAVVRWTSALPRPQPGHRAAMNGLRERVAARPGLRLTGSLVAGTGLAAVVADARAVATDLLRPSGVRTPD